MKRQIRRFTALVALLSTGVTGCAPSRPFYFFEDGDRSHYRSVATEIEYPDVETMPLDEVTNAQAPLTVANNEPQNFWDLSLEETIQNALANGKVLRQLGGQLSSNLTVQGNGFQGAGTQLTGAPGSVTSVYTPALADSDPRFGTEAALSAFDATIDSQIAMANGDDPRNIALTPNVGQFFRQANRQNQMVGYTNIRKRSATGTKFLIGHGVSYDWNNSPTNAFASAWRASADVRFSQPLLQGAGVDFNRIAGPGAIGLPNLPVFNNGINTVGSSTYNINNIGTYNGVVIARINTDIALADFEAGVRNMVSDVENAYWTLYYAYRNLDANVAGRDSSLQTWRKVHAMAAAGAADAAQEAQAREQYFLFRGQVEAALSDLYTSENRLRYMMGLAATDGRLVRPSDEPTTAKVVFDWQESHNEALARSVELRRQRWTVKRRELELIASKNFLLPGLELFAGYRFKGLGDDLISANAGGKAPFSYAYQSLLSGNFQEWDAGLQFDMPIGFRRALSGVRNAELQVARERSILEDQELEVSHQLSEAVRSLDRQYMLSQTNFNRRAAAKRQVEAVQQNYDVGRVTLDQLLDAQRRLADAEARYFESLSAYNRAITAVHYRKGSLLEYNAVFLAEGPWVSKAYFDAGERARKRDAGIFMNYGFTRPYVVSQGPVEQNVGMPGGGEVFYEQGTPVEVDSPEAPMPTEAPGIPTPAPMRELDIIPSEPTSPLTPMPTPMPSTPSTLPLQRLPSSPAPAGSSAPTLQPSVPTPGSGSGSDAAPRRFNEVRRAPGPTLGAASNPVFTPVQQGVRQAEFTTSNHPSDGPSFQSRTPAGTHRPTAIGATR